MLAAIKLERLFNPKILFGILSAVLISSIFAAIALEEYILFLLPFALLLLVLVIWDFRSLYYLLAFSIPMTIEIYLPNGLGIDLPAEALLIVITAIAPVLFITQFHKKQLEFLFHPISIAVLFHLAWILIAGVFAADKVVGLKFFLAKLWYVIPFFLFSIYIFRTERGYKLFFSAVLLPLTLSIFYVLARHASFGFSFSDVNSAVSPIYRNHVNYGLLMVSFLPYIWSFSHWYEKGTWKRNGLYALMLLFLVAIYFTYTRAAQLAVIIAIASYFLIRFRLIVPTLISGSILVIAGVVYLTSNEKYLDYAPQYEKTITHENFDNLLEATVKLEDISTMERVNRWIAGYHMVKERPLTGFGPGNFYFNYKDFTVSSFITYVSDNPDKSGIHNYYLMTMVEQGIIGFLIFIGFLFLAFIYGEKLYHRIRNPKFKHLVMAALISLILIAVVITINDLLEALKTGAFFFIALSILVREGVRNARKTEIEKA